jgi:acetyltransferase
MSIRNLNYLFQPRSVAVIGASERPHSVGATVLRNLLAGGFRGQVLAVNPKYSQLGPLPCHARVQDLPAPPDLAVICTPAPTVPGLIADLGTRGVRAAIVLTAGLAGLAEGGRYTYRQAMLDAARPHLLRILGPQAVGLLMPPIGLNASYAHSGAIAGGLAFVSQSASLATGMLDWANARGIGFSAFVSVGDMADVDLGDLLDYLAGDVQTRAILIYMEDIRQARKFMSAARAAARSKPVVVLKAGRSLEGTRGGVLHSGALAGSDHVYDAAIRRAGMLRVRTTEDLFSAAETLARTPVPGARLAVLSNGAGPALLAADALLHAGGQLAPLSPQSMQALAEYLPFTSAVSNPVSLGADAQAETHASALGVLLRDPNVDAVLLLHAPCALVPSADVAEQVLGPARQAPGRVLASFIGGASAAQATQRLVQAGVAVYNTPEGAVRAFMQLVQYRANQALLIEAPGSLAMPAEPDRLTARAVIQSALGARRELLTEPEAKALLAAYGIPVAATQRVAAPEEAVQAANEIGYPVVLKILSPDVVHKSDVGGVVLDLGNEGAVLQAAEQMRQRVRSLRPDARIDGWSVQAMVRRSQGMELMIGVAEDPVFGPVLLFGDGGVAVEARADYAVALPPLNAVLARDLIGRTRVARLLAGYRDRPAIDLDAVSATLVRVTQLVADMGEVAELDINPLLADGSGVIALDARVRLASRHAGMAGTQRFAIRPYPQELEDTVQWQGGPLLLRPVRPEDGAAHLAFFKALDPEDVRNRAFTFMRALQPLQLARLTQIDYDREMAFIATRKNAAGQDETLAVARAISDPDNLVAEFAVTVRSDLKQQGLGRLLLSKLIEYCRRRGIHALVGETLRQNRGMQELARALGFTVGPPGAEGTVPLRLALRSPQLEA